MTLVLSPRILQVGHPTVPPCPHYLIIKVTLPGNLDIMRRTGRDSSEIAAILLIWVSCFCVHQCFGVLRTKIVWDAERLQNARACRGVEYQCI